MVVYYLLLVMPRNSSCKKIKKINPICWKWLDLVKMVLTFLHGFKKLSRYCTNKKHVIFGGYHGWHDWVIGSSSRSGGIPEAEKKISHKFIFNDFNSILKLHKKLNGDIACIVKKLVARYYPEKNF